MNTHQYYMEVVRSHTNDLCNPRITFNWGYWDARDDMKNGRTLRDLSVTTFHDPYYAAGYIAAQKPYADDKSSEFCWTQYVGSLSQDDYDNTACSVLESIIRGQEYLFVNEKRDRP